MEAFDYGVIIGVDLVDDSLEANRNAFVVVSAESAGKSAAILLGERKGICSEGLLENCKCSSEYGFFILIIEALRDFLVSDILHVFGQKI